jgi:hypothetical protein
MERAAFEPLDITARLVGIAAPIKPLAIVA